MSNARNWLFENEICTRCGGTGRYSRCMTMDGPYGQETCFKCSGKHNVLTKRGAVCQELFTRSLSKQAWQIKVGDFIKPQGSRHFKTVTESYFQWDRIGGYSCLPIDGKYQNHYNWILVCEKACYQMTTSPQHVIRVGWVTEHKQRIADLCLEYQGLLTKQGKPMKKHTERCAEIEALLPDPKQVKCPYKSDVMLTKEEMTCWGLHTDNLK